MKRQISIDEINGQWFVTKKRWHKTLILHNSGNLWLDHGPLDQTVYADLFAFKTYTEAVQAAMTS